MISIFENKPQAGKPLAMKGLAAGLAKMAHFWERLEIIGGHIEWTYGYPRVIIDGQGTDAGLTAASYYPWGIKGIVANAVTLQKCAYRRGPVTVFLSDLSVELSGTETIIAAVIDTEAGTATLTHGGSGTAYDAEVVEDSKYYRLPLYTMTRLNETSSWSVSVDWRIVPQLGIYV